ncbi:MAG: PRC-barrel domain-containing protein [Caulobacteraceae bacterium]
MLIQGSKIRGCSVGATDGPIGSISDILFDDTSWRVRWLVVDTGGFLSGRKVLIPPSALGLVNNIDDQYAVRLSKQQIKDSPGIDTDEPVSRAVEAEHYNYYGWTPYWFPGFYMGGYSYSGAPMAPSGPGLGSRAIAGKSADHTDNDPRLRSAHEVGGYHIHASDGAIGHVADFLIEDGDWSIHYLVVDTARWWPGKMVLVSPRSVLKTHWSDRTVDLDVTRQQIKDSPAYDGSEAVDRAYEQRFHGYYDACRVPEPA